MNIKLINKNIADIKADIKVEFLTPDELKKHKEFKLLNLTGFKAEQDSICFLHEKGLLFCGVDSKKSDDIRSATTSMIKALKSSNYESAVFGALKANSLAAMVEGVVLGGYEFNDYKSKPKENKLENIFIASNELDYKKLKTIFKDALIISNATCFTRDIVNTAPQELNPLSLAYLAQRLADENSLECEIFAEDELKKQNMNAMLAVGRASIHQSQLIHLAYKPKKAKKIISLVGKGLTYDSGGLSLKPSTSMVTMKMDKAGACSVLGIIKAVSELKLDIEVHAFIGAVENMVGGDAYKPDDVLVSRSGTTIEVRNTDAEGRLVLADVLDYAQEKVDADAIFDFATLTGACMVALGQYTTGVMGHSHKLKHEISKAATASGELTGSLPFNKHLKKLIKSEIADISNVSSKPYGGAITAGLFLDNFIKDENKDKWLHFDIAGSAYTETPWDCNVYGATGASVRFMSEYLKNI
ncbi:MAG: leucyl aminopeptidase [Sulfurimonas sp.]|uniref:leucyl aminopeptidase n=1 Tax=Sulfurimonas sp. TaxID=2022749 RepID=UPI0025F6C15E|nr:leucyl aminopeptidase [Sulfurimonas sp.]MCK9491235.1 leucyl aminopeptidase [Sulfurimonas sp.]